MNAHRHYNSYSRIFKDFIISMQMAMLIKCNGLIEKYRSFLFFFFETKIYKHKPINNIYSLLCAYS